MYFTFWKFLLQNVWCFHMVSVFYCSNSKHLIILQFCGSELELGSQWTKMQRSTCIPSGHLGESIFLFFLASKGHPHSLAHGFFLWFQGQVCSIFGQCFIVIPLWFLLLLHCSTFKDSYNYFGPICISRIISLS